MKQFFIKTIILFLLLFIIDKPVGYYISKAAIKKNVDKRLEIALKKEMSPELVILGSSRAYHGFSASIIEKISGYKTYNYGFAGSNIDFHNTVLNLLIHFGIKPKIIILAIDDDKELIENTSINFRFDILNQYAKYDVIDSIICARKKKNYYLTKLSDTYRENINISDAFNYILHGPAKPGPMERYKSDGSMPISEPPKGFLAYDSGYSIYNLNNESEFLRNKYIDLINTCKRNSINLIVVFPSQLYGPTKNFHERIKELGIFYPYITYFDFSTKFKKPELFYDPVHLNIEGYKLFSEDLAHKIDSIKPNLRLTRK
jgi:hypothetical protein